jgi:hypothetical protein
MNNNLYSNLLTQAPPPYAPVNAGSQVWWDEVERSLGTTLPRDYKWLIDTYGSGDFCDLLIVLNPFSECSQDNLQAQMPPALELYQEYRRPFPENCVFPVFPQPGGLLPVAFDTNGGDLFWLTRGHPESWTLSHYNWRGGCLLQQHEMSLIEFLVGWISGEKPESFFGVGNNTSIVRRDPIFCPSNQMRPIRPTAERPPGLW